MKVERVLIGNSLSLMNVYYRDTQTLKFTFNSLFIIITKSRTTTNVQKHPKIYRTHRLQARLALGRFLISK